MKQRHLFAFAEHAIHNMGDAALTVDAGAQLGDLRLDIAFQGRVAARSQPLQRYYVICAFVGSFEDHEAGSAKEICLSMTG